MEGVSHEACSLAGTLGLGKLIVFYDDNGISIDGKVAGWFTDDTPRALRGLRLARHARRRRSRLGRRDARHPGGARRDAATHAHLLQDHHRLRRPAQAGHQGGARRGAGRRRGGRGAQGARLALSAVRRAGGDPRRWDHRSEGAAVEREWRELFTRYAQAFPELAREFERRMRGELPPNWAATAAQTLQTLLQQIGTAGHPPVLAGGAQCVGPALPEILGGSADLTGSNNTLFKGARTITPGAETRGNYLHYGVREFGMTAIMNGVSLHGGFIRYGGTFLVFSDYARNAVRLACLDEAAHHPGVHARLHRPGRGRSDPPADRAPEQPARHAQHEPVASVRCGRDRGGLDTSRSSARDRRALVLTRQALPQQPRTRGAAGRYPPRRLRPDRVQRHARVPGDRHRLRGRSCGAGGQCA